MDGIGGEGLLLAPTGTKAVASVVAIPDCSQTPEMLAGLVEGIPPDCQFARRLAENGCRVIVPALIDRGTQFSVIAAGQRRGNVTHREMLYRSAYQMGRHLIGYEVQKVLAAIDWFAKDSAERSVGVVGYGEGGLLALYAAALDTRISVGGFSPAFSTLKDGEPGASNLRTGGRAKADKNVKISNVACGLDMRHPKWIRDRVPGS